MIKNHSPQQACQDIQVFAEWFAIRHSQNMNPSPLKHQTHFSHVLFWHASVILAPKPTPSIKINHIPILKTPDASFLVLENPQTKCVCLVAFEQEQLFLWIGDGITRKTLTRSNFSGKRSTKLQFRKWLNHVTRAKCRVFPGNLNPKRGKNLYDSRSPPWV